MTDRELLEFWRPVLVYDSRERYFADAPSTLVENEFLGGPSADYCTRLLNEHGDEIASVRDSDDRSLLRLRYLTAGPRYPNGYLVSETDYLDPGLEPVADARKAHTSRHRADRLYGRVARDGDGGRWLQYWLFYFSSAKGIPGVRNASGLLGFGLHDGDWEMVQWHVPAGKNKPDVATFAAHKYGHSIDFSKVEIDAKLDGPVVYVALASHASYPFRGRWRGKKIGPFRFGVLDDVCDAEGVRRRPSVVRLDDGRTPWDNWPGRWGATKFKGEPSSPRGPRFQGEKWTDPTAFHKDAHPYEESWASDSLEESGRDWSDHSVQVTRDGAKWLVSFEITHELAERWAGSLILVMNDPGGPPVPLEYDISEPGEHRPL
jgi:hypothetical protein